MNNNINLVSIIIAYYKKKKFFEKTLNSILNQTFSNFEIIIIYDDEENHELKFIKELTIKDKRIRLLINQKNMGVSYSRNQGLLNAKGKYICFIDADDTWTSNKIEKQINFMIKNNSKFCYTSYYVIDEHDNILTKRPVSSKINYDKLSKSCEIGLSTVMIHRDLLNLANFPNLQTQEDFAFWLKLSRSGINFLSMDEYLSYWRKTDNSLSSNIIQKLKDSFKIYYKFENKNFIIAIYSVLMLSLNKLIKK